METNRIVAGLDVHKDTIFLCIMGHDGSIIFQKKYCVPIPHVQYGHISVVKHRQPELSHPVVHGIVAGEFPESVSQYLLENPDYGDHCPFGP